MEFKSKSPGRESHGRGHKQLETAILRGGSIYDLSKPRPSMKTNLRKNPKETGLAIPTPPYAKRTRRGFRVGRKQLISLLY